MGLVLFKHNQEAYNSALKMLQTKKKAAVIHPTGTGKSFIGFKLAEDHPDVAVCWLSPSEYIFRTQVENWLSAGGKKPENIVFITYAKLILMSEEELKSIHPGYMVLDEFHRAGSEIWGRSVKKLLELYPDVPVLGLSATNIRYLDNQRDMADELFDGNVASDITLGEAIVRGILNAPKYVLSVFSYQKELENYKAKIKRAKNKAVRDKAEQYLEALRRALEKADGLEEIFQKHMTEPHGKYIVFCANFDHMREMMDKANEWFRLVDKEPRIFSVYSDDPAASTSFSEFKEDSDPSHLRLLYCIDALNEGIHLDDISGVILLRPTVSPIIYKQQIGRALSASKKKNAVIFDIVMNIENLYSIGMLEDEMQIAMTYYRSLGESEAIVNERFRIIDEVRDCRVLFEKLNDTLSASWDIMYEKAKDYFLQNGDLAVPHHYKTDEGYSLGNWLQTQRKVRSGEQYGALTSDRIRLLDEIGMIWSGYRDMSWERNLAAAREYYEVFGNLNVNISYITEDGIHLGAWISNLRTAKKNGSQRKYLTEERIAALDEIGMIWDVSDMLWQQYYGACLTYYREYGDLDIPTGYVTGDGLRLGTWILNIRASYNGSNKNYRLNAWQIQALNEIGMLWDKKFDRLWEKGYKEAALYRKANGNLDVPATFKTDSGYALGKWITRQRDNKDLSEYRKNKLTDIGMIWKKDDPWEKRFSLAKAYFEEHGDLNVPSKYIADGVWLNKWLNEQKQIYFGRRGSKTLSADQIQRLEAIGMVWESKNSMKMTIHEKSNLNRQNSIAESTAI